MSEVGASELKALLAALHRKDGSVVDVLAGPWPQDSLQLVGEALLDAVLVHTPGAAALAHRCVRALNERVWEGDGELAFQLECALGRGGPNTLQPLPIDLDMLSSFLEGDPLDGGVRINLDTGDCWPENWDDPLRDEDSVDDDPERWLHLDSLGSREGYLDMEEFIDTLQDPAIADRLKIAITGRGAFRRFKDVLSHWPEELARFLRFSDERKRGRARAALAASGYRPGSAGTGTE